MKIAESLSGSCASTKYTKPRVTAAVSPDKSGQCEKFQAWQYRSGAWHPLTTSGCYPLTANGTSATRLTLTNAVGQRFRVCSEYVQSAQDDTNVTTWGGWLCFTVRT
ncbi:hypothetical protein ACPCBC_22090 [Streptomyces incarnatus]